MPCMPSSRCQPPTWLGLCTSRPPVSGNFHCCPSHSRGSRYLYYQSFGVDACFRFKRRDISSYERDPELGPGFAYVVSWKPYQDYLLSHANQSEVACLASVFGLRLTTNLRLAPVPASLPSSTQIPSFPRVIRQPVLSAQHARTSSFSQKGLASSRRVRGLC